MQEIGPRELLGRRVSDDKGAPLGVIKGVHQLRMAGGFEEVTIQNGRSLIFARIDELSSSDKGFVLANGFHRVE
jgi:hypothetical protein